MAMTILKAKEELNKNINASIIATDIDTNVYNMQQMVFIDILNLQKNFLG